MRARRTIERVLALVGPLAAAGLVGLASCGDNDEGKPSEPQAMSRDTLLDPTTCAECHEDHYREWSGSMHAYASKDPVFLALNKRGQRETGGKLGDFCVKCHAPMAVREGATKDGLNLDEVPEKLKGITCFFCHTTESIEAGHLSNSPLMLSKEPVMHGPFSDPSENPAHRSKYSELLDRDARPSSSAACGTCHDIVTPQGAAVERTFAEWRESVFNHELGGQSCGQCHMAANRGDPVPVSSFPSAKPRRRHEHTFAGVDVAITPFPEMAAQRAAIDKMLGDTLQTGLCVNRTGSGFSMKVIVDNIGAGHNFPSGASQDRRAYMEVIAYSGTDVIYKSGVFQDNQVVSNEGDPDLWLLHDCNFDAAGKETHLFFDAASYESLTLPAKPTFDRLDPRYYITHVVQSYPRSVEVPFIPGNPDRVTLRVRIQPIGLEILDDLVASGDLAREHRDAMPTLDVGKPLEWTVAAANASYVDEGSRISYSCITNTNLIFASTSTPATKPTRCKF